MEDQLPFKSVNSVSRQARNPKVAGGNKLKGVGTFFSLF